MIEELNNTCILRDGLSEIQEKLIAELYRMAGFAGGDEYLDNNGNCIGVNDYDVGHWHLSKAFKEITLEQLTKMVQNHNKSNLDLARELIDHEAIAEYASDILAKGQEILAERGAEYQQVQERSFTRTANAFNSITGKDLRPSEVCLLLQILKDVRQWQNPERAHMDSLVDCVNYAALKAEEIIQECKK